MVPYVGRMSRSVRYVVDTCPRKGGSPSPRNVEHGFIQRGQNSISSFQPSLPMQDQPGAMESALNGSDTGLGTCV